MKYKLLAVALMLAPAMLAGTHCTEERCIHSFGRGMERGASATAHAAKGAGHAVVTGAKSGVKDVGKSVAWIFDR